MFSTCLFCHGSLGANDAIEHFPVGKRLAFDGERGRLWAVCPRCARWNLAPIEERWEALEACEKAYRAATKRVSTDNIALARLKDGTDLVRIGQPLLPEFAAWRYGGELRRRSHRAVTIVAATSGVAAVATTAKLVGGAALAGSGAGVALGVAAAAGQWGFAARMLRRGLPQIAVREVDGRLWGISSNDMWRARIGVTADHQLRVTIRDRPLRVPSAIGRALLAQYAWDTSSARDPGPRDVIGDEARRLLRLALPLAHRDGGTRREVREAVAHLESAWVGRGLPAEEVIARWLTDPGGARGAAAEVEIGRPFNLVPASLRLAAEMALHDDDERRALAGELGALYARWQDAERVARLADGELTRFASAE